LILAGTRIASNARIGKLERTMLTLMMVVAVLTKTPVAQQKTANKMLPSRTSVVSNC
jgi:hypothetical protein